MAKNKKTWASANDVEIPPELIRAIQSRRCVVFIGAGVSQASGLPGWKSLLSDLINWCKSEKIVLSKKTVINQSLKKNELLEVAEEIKSQIGGENLRRYLSEVFHDPLIRPSKSQEILAEIPFAGRVTTNYDKLHESAYLEKCKTSLTVMTHRQAAELSAALREGKDFLVKAHGDIDQSDTIILTSSDYRELIHGNKKYQVFFQSLFSTKKVLFVGCSLADPDFRLFLEELKTTFQGHVETHYALLPAQQYTPLKLKSLQDEFGICALEYAATKGHPEVLYFLERLKCESNPQNIFLTQLPTIQDQFKDSDFIYRYGTDGSISVSPKDSDAYNQNPEKISLELQFDLKTEEGRAAYEKWQQHLDTGKGITLPAQHIKVPHFPDFGLPTSITDTQLEWIELRPVASKEIRPTKLEIENKNGQSFFFHRLGLRVVQQGRREITFSNAGDTHRFKLTLTYSPEEKTCNITWKYNVEDLNVKEAFEAETFFQAWSQGGILRLIDEQTGFEILDDDLPPRGIEEPDEHWLSLLNDLVFIQAKTKTLLTLPKREISREEWKLIRLLVRILKTGRISIEPQTLEGVSTKKKLQMSLPTISPNTVFRFYIEPREQVTYEIFDTKITVGAVIGIQDSSFASEEITRLQNLISDKKISADSSVEFTAQPAMEGMHEALFIEWLSKTEREQWEKVLPSSEINPIN